MDFVLLLCQDDRQWPLLIFDTGKDQEAKTSKKFQDTSLDNAIFLQPRNFGIDYRGHDSLLFELVINKLIVVSKKTTQAK